MSNPKISVIVPVYNVETFIVRCVESIVFQTYDNVEIILVDDGSTDSSGTICDQLANKYHNITTYHKKNGGLSDARNYGMDRMHGDYFLFVDSDDYINSNALSIMYSNLIALNVDVIECEFRVVEGTYFRNYYFNEYIARKDSIEAFLYQTIKWKEHYSTAWNKLFKTSIFGDLRFKFGKCNEDEFFVNEWMKRTTHIGYISAKLYYYTKRFNSIMAMPYSIKRIDAIEAYVQRADIIKYYYPKVFDDFINFIANHVYGKLELVEKMNSDTTEEIKKRMALTLEPVKSHLLEGIKVNEMIKNRLRVLFYDYLPVEDE